MSRNTSVIPFRQPDAVDDARSGRARGRRWSNAGASCRLLKLTPSSPCGIKERTTKLYRRRGRLSFGGKASFACPLILDL